MVAYLYCDDSCFMSTSYVVDPHQTQPQLQPDQRHQAQQQQQQQQQEQELQQDMYMDVEEKHNSCEAPNTCTALPAQSHQDPVCESASINMNASATLTPREDHNTSCLTDLLALHRDFRSPLGHARQLVYDTYWLTSRVEYTPHTPRVTGLTSYALLGTWAVRAIAMWQLVFNVSDAATEFVIKLINCLIRCLGHGTHGGMPNSKGKTDDDWFPSSLHTLQARLNTVNIGKREDELITRFVLCPNPSCGARYHMGQAIELMVCQASLWVRRAPRARTWVQQPCQTRLFRTLNRPLHHEHGAGHGQPPQKQPHLHKYEKEARNHVPDQEQQQSVHVQRHERGQEHKQEQEHKMDPDPERPNTSKKRRGRPMSGDTSRRVSLRIREAAASASGSGGHVSVSVFGERSSVPVPPPPLLAPEPAYPTYYVPECMYPYCGIIAPLKIMLMRKGFEEACKRHQWRGRPGGAHGNSKQAHTHTHSMFNSRSVSCSSMLMLLYTCRF